jgi:hypothetical protein
MKIQNTFCSWVRKVNQAQLIALQRKKGCKSCSSLLTATFARLWESDFLARQSAHAPSRLVRIKVDQ